MTEARIQTKQGQRWALLPEVGLNFYDATQGGAVHRCAADDAFIHLFIVNP